MAIFTVYMWLFCRKANARLTNYEPGCTSAVVDPLQKLKVT